MLLAVLALALGLVVMSYAADRFVVGASALAERFKVPAIVTGALVVGFGTSLPELLVTSRAAASGDLALGVANAFGSNVANLTLVLGIAALIAPVAADRATRTRLLPLAGGVTLVAAALVVDGSVARVPDAALLGVVALLSLVVLLRTGREPGPDPDPTNSSPHDPTQRSCQDEAPAVMGIAAALTASLLGLAFVLGGAETVVRAATFIAERFGLSGGLIGLSLVAVGTSLPELAAAVAAARRGASGLVLGNVLGSNVWNVSMVLLAGILVAPGEIGDLAASRVGPGAALVATVLVGVALVARRRSTLTRPFGFVLLAVWLATIPLAA
jgi:cation:H+ antiporter